MSILHCISSSTEYPFLDSNPGVFEFVSCTEQYTVDVRDPLEASNMLSMKGGGSHRNEETANNEDITNNDDITTYEARDCGDT